MSKIAHKDKISFLFSLFIKENCSIEPRFKQELVAANRLIKKYPDFDFFFSLPELTGQFNSLFGLLTERNNIELSEKYKNFVIEKSKNMQYDLTGNL